MGQREVVGQREEGEYKNDEGEDRKKGEGVEGEKEDIEGKEGKGRGEG